MVYDFTSLTLRLENTILKHNCHSLLTKKTIASMDRLSQLPDNVIDGILCSMPLSDAVKSCVLAKAWRHKWVTLSKLQFDCAAIGQRDDKKGLKLVTNLLLQHIGTLDALRLWFPRSVNSVDISPLIKFALRKGVRTLSLSCNVAPACVYTCTQLTCLELHLYRCTFPLLPASFEGLPNLISFELCIGVPNDEDADKISQFISCCPEIKKLSLIKNESKVMDLHFRAAALEYLSLIGTFRLVRLRETENLKELEMLVDSIDHVCFAEKCRKMDCFYRGLMKLEYLTLDAYDLQFFFAHEAPYTRRLSTTLGQLKVLKLSGLDLSDKLVREVLCLLASSPKLNKFILIDDTSVDDEETQIDPYIIDSYRDQKFENLHTVEVHTEGLEFHIKMIGFFLGCSPNLEMMSIHFGHYSEYVDEGYQILQKVTRFTRASSKAVVQWCTSCAPQH